MRVALFTIVPNWRLTIIGQQLPTITVSTTDPDGNVITETITLTMDTQNEIHDLLLRSYEEWRARNVASPKKSPR